mmetsp:Transcript_110572/g.323532  ORF Transcript_110572/g.323532 Transcript_110572/m.323532 type:complete len:338 (-) Transcript_110572:889-1902(-)
MLHARARPVGAGQSQGRQAQLRKTLSFWTAIRWLEADSLRQARASSPTGVNSPRVPQEEASSWHQSTTSMKGPPLRQLPGKIDVLHLLDLTVVKALLPRADKHLILHHLLPHTPVAARPNHGCGAVTVRSRWPDINDALVALQISKARPHVVHVLVHMRTEPVPLGWWLPFRSKEGYVHAGDQFACVRVYGPVDLENVRVPSGTPCKTSVGYAVLDREPRGRCQTPNVLEWEGPWSRSLELTIRLLDICSFRPGLPQSILVHKIMEVLCKIGLQSYQFLLWNDVRDNRYAILIQCLPEFLGNLCEWHGKPLKFILCHDRCSVHSRVKGVLSTELGVI